MMEEKKHLSKAEQERDRIYQSKLIQNEREEKRREEEEQQRRKEQFRKEAIGHWEESKRIKDLQREGKINS
jgi:hypothetical protein